jgi:hypothetical protein
MLGARQVAGRESRISARRSNIRPFCERNLASSLFNDTLDVALFPAAPGKAHRCRRLAVQPFLAVFVLAFANGDVALPALIAAQRFFAASAIALLPAALRVRFRATSADDGTTSGALGFLIPGGRPRRFVEPCSAWIAASSRFRSATSKATICSVCMTGS